MRTVRVLSRARVCDVMAGGLSERVSECARFAFSRS